jgi:hypothetical protein
MQNRLPEREVPGARDYELLGVLTPKPAGDCCERSAIDDLASHLIIAPARLCSPSRSQPCGSKADMKNSNYCCRRLEQREW